MSYFPDINFANVHQGYAPGYNGIAQHLTQRAMRTPGSPHVSSGVWTGKRKISVPEMVIELQALGGHLYFVSRKFARENEEIEYASLSWDHGVVTVDKHGADNVVIYWTSTDSAFRQKLADWSKDRLLPPEAKGEIYVLTMGSNGPQMTSTGFAGVDLERDNYDPAVIEGFDHMVADLGNKDPCGRIVLLDGKPGTGKTYLARSMLSTVSKARFVILPPDLVSQLSGPGLIKVLIDYAQKDGPLVFLIEDADQCLVKRGPDNMGSLSSLLNLSDGILGSVLDIRIVATTNAGHVGKDGMDEALMRDGRLCRRIEVGPLDRQQAIRVYNRISKSDRGYGLPTGDRFTLAEIYKRAKHSDACVAPEKKKGAIGFQAEPPSTPQKAEEVSFYSRRPTG